MRTNRRFFFLALVALWWMRAGSLGAQPGRIPYLCDDVCSGSGSCTDTCYATQLDFDNGNPTSCYTWGVYGMPCCGDGTCSEGEDYSNCFADCHCGDGICNAGENSSTCPADCTGGGGPPDCTGDCIGDDETCDDCPQDCSTREDVCGYCGDGTCEANETGGAGSAHDGQCDPESDAWCTYCPEDCGACQPSACWQYVCDDSNGGCTSCEDDSDCDLYPPGICHDGICMQSDYCFEDLDCYLEYGYDWYCDSGVCRPVY